MEELSLDNSQWSVSPEKLAMMISRNAHSFWLDSSDHVHREKGCSYFGFNPRIVYQNILKSFDVLGEVEQKLKEKQGFLVSAHGFESFSEIEEFKFQLEPSQNWLAIYDAVFKVDHSEHRLSLLSYDQVDIAALMKLFEIKVVAQNKEYPVQWMKKPKSQEYVEKINRIKTYLTKGDTYQINYTEEFNLQSSKPTYQTYLDLRKVSPVPYGAYINCGKYEILSGSPECFFELNGQEIRTLPIKGTSPRFKDKSLDEESKTKLMQSKKDQAELLMIVDLERNDLGKICETGTVRVDPLYGIESFSQVHHQVAQVFGNLKKNVDLKHIFSALFPGGSITGAPKKRSIEIIKELEEHKRDVYTGALGFYDSANNHAVYNIPIRTMIYQQGSYRFFAGGGIVIDSEPLKEYEEMLLKAKSMLNALGLEDI